jgi:hypothetical protein
MVGRLRHYRCLVEAQLASHADVLRSNAGNDVLKGNRGADRLRGGSGLDRCCGGAGVDSIRGVSGRPHHEPGRVARPDPRVGASMVGVVSRAGCRGACIRLWLHGSLTDAASSLAAVVRRCQAAFSSPHGYDRERGIQDSNLESPVGDRAPITWKRGTQRGASRRSAGNRSQSVGTRRTCRRRNESFVQLRSARSPARRPAPAPRP